MDDNFAIYEAPLELINVPKTDSNTLCSLVKDCLVRFPLPIPQCRGQAYDRASNMSGHIRGVAAQIQREEPSAPSLFGSLHKSLFTNCREGHFSYQRCTGISDGFKSIDTKAITLIPVNAVPNVTWCSKP